MTIDTERIRDAAEVLDTLTSQLPAGHPLRADADARAKSCVAALYSAADAIDAQTAEITRMRAALEAIGTYPLARGQEMSAESMREIARAALAQEGS